MITVKQLKEFIKDYEDNLEVIWQDGSEISHISNCNDLLVLANHKPTRYCSKCGEYVFKTPKEQYFCPECDEYLYSFETELINKKEIMKEKQLFDTTALVSFGNYLLSALRKENLINKTNEICVTDADLANWLEKVDE